MKAIGSIFITFIAAGGVFAAQPTTVPAVVSQAMLVQRANADAVSRLYAQIAAESVAGMPIAQIIEQVQGHTILMNGLAKAEQVGGPRVVGEDFIQVQLQISGPRAVQLVLQAVSVKPEKSPISADRLAFLLQDWNHRVFTSTGASLTHSPDGALVQAMSTTTSTTASVAPRVTDLKFDVMPAWVNDPIVGSATAERGPSALRTARAAERAARDTFRLKIESLILTGETKLRDVSQVDDAVRDVIDDAVEAAKIVGVDYRSNGSVDVRIALDGRQLWQAILATR